MYTYTIQEITAVLLGLAGLVTAIVTSDYTACAIFLVGAAYLVTYPARGFYRVTE